MSGEATRATGGSRGFGAAGQAGLAAGASLATAVVVAAGGSPAVALAAGLVLAVAAWLLLSRQLARGLLFLTVLCAPIDIGKSLVAPSSVFVPDAPGLSVSPMDLAALGWIALWLWQRLAVERRAIAWTRIDLGALVFLGWIWFEALRSPAGTLALATALAYSKYVAVFLVASHAVRSSDEWRAVVAAAALTFAVAAPHVAAQVLTQSPLALPGAKLPEAASVVSLGSEGGSAFRPMGFFNHPNALADYLVLLLPTPLCLVLVGRARTSPRVWALSLAILGAGCAMLALTLTRGGWIAFGVAALACTLACRRAGAISARQLRLGALAALVLGAAVLAATPRLLLRLTEPDSRSLESRALLAEHALEMIADRPLLGVGFGGYHRASADYGAPGFAKVSADYQKGLRRLVVHNHYLLLAVELGVPAVAGFAVLMLALVAGVLPLRGWDDAGRFCLAVGLASALLGNLVFLSSDNYYADIRMAMLWLVAGLLQAVCLGRTNAPRRQERAA